MMTTKALLRRIEKIEARRRLADGRPRFIAIRGGESLEEAAARQGIDLDRFGPVIVIPEKEASI